MKAYLAGVHCRKEILSQTSDEHQASQTEKEKAACEERAVIQTQLQQVRVASLDRIKAALEAVMDSGENASAPFLFWMLVFRNFFSHQVHDQRRHQGA